MWQAKLRLPESDVIREGLMWQYRSQGGGGGRGMGSGARLFSTSAMSKEPNDCCMDAGFVRCVHTSSCLLMPPDASSGVCMPRHDCSCLVMTAHASS